MGGCARQSADKILALDLATETGWAFGQRGHCTLFGTWNLLPKGEPRPNRFRNLIVNLDRVAHSFGGIPDLIVYEDVKFTAGSPRVWCGLLAFLQVWCCDKTTLEPFAINTIKKFATGNGRADKQMMLKSARHKWGDTVPDHNSADALWLLELARGDDYEQRVQAVPG